MKGKLFPVHIPHQRLCLVSMGTLENRPIMRRKSHIDKWRMRVVLRAQSRIPDKPRLAGRFPTRLTVNIQRAMRHTPDQREGWSMAEHQSEGAGIRIWSCFIRTNLPYQLMP